MKLSVSMIVKNEEACLAKCLESIKEADEIVIIDTGSTDKTGDIARRYTDKFIENEYKWKDDFAEARNFSLSKCTGDWILTIDADEELMPGGIEAIKKEIKKTIQNSIGVKVRFKNSATWWWSPRIYLRCPEIYWKGAIHNYLQNAVYGKSSIVITASSSPAHRQDPNRALRILKKEVTKNPKCVRELYYLGREYWYKKNWTKALYWLSRYLNCNGWAAERADGFLVKARCLWNLRRGEEARAAAIEAIKINADFKEAIEFMAYISGPKNKDRWLEFAETAKSQNVLIDRTTKEKDSEYYDAAFTHFPDLNRYELIFMKAAEWAEGYILDIGCGPAELQKYVDKKDYHGFDISRVAIEKAGSENVWVGDAYEEENYLGLNYDTYMALEVLEHLDDIRIIKNIPAGRKLIFSVPSFPDASHLRMYTEGVVRRRFRDLIKIEEILRFNWTGKWTPQKPDTNDFILLIKGERI